MTSARARTPPWFAWLRAILTALETFRAYPLRTLLSTLGVVIGVASLVAILALGDGLEAYGRRQIAGTTDLQTIMVRSRTDVTENGVRVLREHIESLGTSDADALGAALTGRADVTAFLPGSAWARVPGDETKHAVLLAATTPTAVSQLRGGLAAGRYLSAEDMRSDANVVVVPESVAEWYRATPDELPGRSMLIDGVDWRIVGVTRGEGGPAVRLHIPLTERERARLERPDRKITLAVRARRVEDVEPLTADVEKWLASRYGSAEPFDVSSNRGRVAQARKGMLVFKLVMGAIAGISLLVGGIGIMNILLASVLERTREIGVRKAIGARQRDILLQFLAEAVTITSVGSFLGVIVGLVGAFTITAVIRRYTEAQVYAAFTWASVLVAAGAAILVGLIFGTYPARRAAQLSPIDAIRTE